MKSGATVDTERECLPFAGKLHEVFDSGRWSSEIVRVCLFSTKTTFRLAEFKRGRWEASDDGWVDQQERPDLPETVSEPFLFSNTGTR